MLEPVKLNIITHDLGLSCEGTLAISLEIIPCNYH